MRCVGVCLFLLTMSSSCRPGEGAVKETYGVSRVRQVAESINSELEGIRKRVESLAEETAALYNPAAIGTHPPPADSASTYVLSPAGVLYKPGNDGKSAVFVSGHVPVDDEIRRIVRTTEPLDHCLRKVVEDIPAVVQAYYNDRNSYNRIYPFFDVISQYEPGMNIPEYNFYYLADAEHNPSHSGVWVSSPYVDPAGRGWMVSAIAPVYVDGRLEGVPGLDVTVNTITERYIQSGGGDFALLSADGMVVAVADRLAVLLSLPPLKNHQYLETILTDTFRSDDYNLLKSRTRSVREFAEAILVRKETDTSLVAGGRTYRFSAATVKEVDWTLIGLCPP